MRHIYLLLPPLLCPIVVLAKSDETHHPSIVARHKHKPKPKPTLKAHKVAKVAENASHAHPQVSNQSTLKQSVNPVPKPKPQPLFNVSIFHSEHPAFPFLVAGKAMPAEPKTRARFSRDCFHFIYTATVNLTTIDDSSYFYHLFNRQCVLGNNKTCGHWSNELLQAVKKKMMAVKLLGKDGHIGRAKKPTADEEFESRLPPTLTGVTSYANWCDELYEDLATHKPEATHNKEAAEDATKEWMNAAKADATKWGPPEVTKEATEPPEVTKEATQPEAKAATKAATTVAAKAKAVSQPVTLKVDKKSEPMKESKADTKTPVEPARAVHGHPWYNKPKPVNPLIKALHAKDHNQTKPVPTKPPSNCICVERADGKHCHCAKHDADASAKESSDAVPFKDVTNQLRGVAIAEQASAANEDDKELDGLEAVMHKARSAAEGQKTQPKHKKHA